MKAATTGLDPATPLPVPGVAEIRRSLGTLASREELRQWSSPRTLRLVLDASLVWLQAVIGIAVFVVWPGAAGFIVAWALIGGAQHGLGLVAHEGAHRLLTPRSGPLNDRIARWLFAAPIALPFSLYRKRHLAHHRYVSTPEDTKQLYQKDFAGWKFVLEILRAVSGVEYVQQVLRTLYPQPRSSAPTPADRSWLYPDITSIVLAQIAIAALFVLIDVRLYVALWLFPLVTTSMLWSKLRSVVEHHPYAQDVASGSGGVYFLDTAAPCLRSVAASAFERLLFTKINFNYHCEHHLWPHVSYQYLVRLNSRLGAADAWNSSGLSFGAGYLTTLYRIARQR